MILASYVESMASVSLKLSFLMPSHGTVDGDYIPQTFCCFRKTALNWSPGNLFLIRIDCSSIQNIVVSKLPTLITFQHFKRGTASAFKVWLPNTLGWLETMEIWHDNSGKNPHWFLDKVLVKESNEEQRWITVFCNNIQLSAQMWLLLSYSFSYDKVHLAVCMTEWIELEVVGLMKRLC